MKSEPKEDLDFKAWCDIEPPGDFTQNVMRRIRTAPAQEPRWHEIVAAFFSSRLAYTAALSASLVVALLALRSSPHNPMASDLQPNSLMVAYAKMAEGR